MASRVSGDPIRNALVVANVFSLLLYSPNFASVVYPALKGLQFAIFVLTAGFLSLTAAWRIDRLVGMFVLFLVFVVLSAAVNYLRFDNAESLYLALSYVVKGVSAVMLFQLCRLPGELDRMLRLCAGMLVAYALHGIAQFIAVPLGLVTPQGSIELLGYEFVDVGWAGIYRVAFPVGDFNLIRIQSFFQEPGFFAFYLLIGLILLDYAGMRAPFRNLLLCRGVLITAMVLTLSLTGVALMLAYLAVRTRSWLFRVAVAMVALFVIDFIIFNESEFVAKAGSLDMRLESYALLQDLVSSWKNIAFGVGFGNEALISDLRVNNFIPELLMYSSVFGLLVMIALLALAMRGGHKTNHIVLVALLYSLSTPMFWSPLFLLAVFVSWRASRARTQPSAPRAAAVA